MWQENITFWSIEHARKRYSVDALSNSALSCCLELSKFRISKIEISKELFFTAPTQLGQGIDNVR